MVNTAAKSDVSVVAPQRSGWRRLTVISGSLAALAAGGVALHLTDIEGGVVAMAFAISTWLVARGKDRTGAIGLILVSAITIYFMATAAFTNLEGWAGAEGVLISTGLCALSIMALLTTIGFSIRRDRPAGHAFWLVVGSALVVLLVPVFSGAVSREQPVREADLEVVAENVAFDQQVLSTAPGSITVSLENRDLFWHTFTIEELGVDLRVPVSAEMTVTFDAPAGEYTFICDIPGHPEAGMEGTLLVEG